MQSNELPSVPPSNLQKKVLQGSYQENDGQSIAVAFGNVSVVDG
jgi:hypothetical protein